MISGPMRIKSDLKELTKQCSAILPMRNITMKRTSGTEKNPKEKPSAHKQSPFNKSIKTGATRDERKAIGRLAREKAPLESHAGMYIPATGRDIIKVLEKSNEGRIPELIPIRYGRMLVSPFTFFRGSAALMALDLAETPTSGFVVQACGDCHIHNMGVFATPERKLVIDINDFDETLPAPWEWDVKRLATSLVLAGKSNGFSAQLGQEAARLMARKYREHMAKLSTMSALQVWYAHIEVDRLTEISKGDTRRRQSADLKSAVAKSSPEIMTQKMTAMSNGKLRFRDIPPLISHVEGLGAGQHEQKAFEDYRDSLPEDRRVLLDRFELVDVARKVVGVGSVGTMCGVVLLLSSEQDALILQLKEARESVLAPYAGASQYEHQGHRVVAGQKLMQAASDMFLGWTTARRPPHYHFYVRQLRDVKIGTNTALWSKEEFRVLPGLAGEILARAHARSGDAAVLRGYIGKSGVFDEAIADYAVAYAKQTEQDYMQFLNACKSGQLEAQTID